MSKLLVSLFIGLIAFSALAQANPHYGFCRVSYPNESDLTGTACVGNNGFGLVYAVGGMDWYLVSDKPCYPSLDQAESAMYSYAICNEETHYGKCGILFPGRADSAGKTCKEFGIAALNGWYLVGSDACFNDLAEAVQAMKTRSACQ